MAGASDLSTRSVAANTSSMTPRRDASTTPAPRLCTNVFMTPAVDSMRRNRRGRVASATVLTMVSRPSQNELCTARTSPLYALPTSPTARAASRIAGAMLAVAFSNSSVDLPAASTASEKPIVATLNVPTAAPATAIAPGSAAVTPTRGAIDRTTPDAWDVSDSNADDSIPTRVVVAARPSRWSYMRDSSTPDLAPALPMSFSLRAVRSMPFSASRPFDTMRTERIADLPIASRFLILRLDHVEICDKHLGRQLGQHVEWLAEPHRHLHE